ncbi:phosphatidylglycerophosphatase A [Rodentibacter pneumotropicus]|uniref:phosphatidylglycerophosphatase A family protein n=1 Tax=Rodentibacter pneumotropicus TaxID=758 RepID=UPI00036E1383|nr:phosphatidylglycerophosphatase A [Rodentibacter pneumotropicus]NBH74838.1 phosphatidylglycerophosphatase A [Rodentibacter pneumotropicus]OOF60799.1 phosphatidylglycerophosphatase [Rodentibacter pneumotropicus]THA01943.1 phosphatidylglycerophosphatase A [Rodentibacter pneumotropicus]THA05784.1 phosphatidylglycerophosphatase A [Rodentibacter pneumotropicus]THA12684.1 phosphatidylglycerophosphatase A [Rodentibacter pneumotropicus]
MIENNPLKRISLKNPVHLLAVGLGSGLLRPAPGTWGSALGTLLGVILLVLLGTKTFLILTALCFVLGCYLCQKTADDMGVHDHGAIVWDEFVGVFIVLAAIPTLSLLWIVTAFVLFRFFDILKPFPIRFFDKKLESGFGIMVDDVLAAIYAVVVIFLIQIWR